MADKISPPLDSRVLRRIKRLNGRLPADFTPIEMTVNTPAGPHPVPPAIQALLAIEWPADHKMLYRPFDYDWPIQLFHCSETGAGLCSETRPWLTVGYNESQYYHLVDLSDTDSDPRIYDVDHEGDQDAGGGERLSQFLSKVRLPKPAKPSEKLARACAIGDFTAVTECLKDSPDLGSVNSTGLTPLHIAVMHRSLEMVKALLEAGADPNAKLTRRIERLPEYMEDYSWSTRPAGGETPLDMALNTTPSWAYSPQFSAPLVHLLLDGGADPRMLSRQARYLSWPEWVRLGFEKVLPQMVTAGFDLRKVNARKDSLIRYALHSRGDLLAFLMEQGIDPSETIPGYDDGVTLLHEAVAVGDERNLRTVVAAASDINVATKAGLTPLHTAINQKDTTSLEILLAAGADPARPVPNPKALAEDLTATLPVEIARELGKPEAAALLDQATA